MANTLLKGLALTLGGGVALGVGIKIGQTAAGQSTGVPAEIPAADLDPVLDRLGTMESRIVQVEYALAEGPVAPNPAFAEPIQKTLVTLEDRLASQSGEMEDLRRDLREVDQRSSERIEAFGKNVEELRSRLPALIEESVGTCFHQMEVKLQRDIEETHTRTLETFVDSIQTRVVQRITSFETDLATQAESMNQLREYSLKTDQNMQRLLVGVDRRASEIAKKPDHQPGAQLPAEALARVRPVSPPAAPPVSSASKMEAAEQKAPPPPAAPKPNSPASDSPLAPKVPESPKVAATRTSPDPDPSKPSFVPKSFTETPEDESKGRNRWKYPIISAAVLVGIAGFEFSDKLLPVSAKPRMAAKAAPTRTPPPVQPIVSPNPTVKTTGATAVANAGEPSGKKIESAEEFARRKEYGKAEAVYQSLLKEDPKNTQVAYALTDVLYKQHKFEDAARVMESVKIPE